MSIFIMNLNIFIFFFVCQRCFTNVKNCPLLFAVLIWAVISSVLFSWLFLISSLIPFRSQFLSFLKFLTITESLLLLIFVRIYLFIYFGLAAVQLLDCIFGSSLILVLQSQQFFLQSPWVCFWFFPMTLPIGVCLPDTCQLHFGIVHILLYFLDFQWSFCWSC